MKYIFETDVKIKSCFKCPMYNYDFHGVEHCSLGLNDDEIDLDFIPNKCPLTKIDENHIAEIKMSRFKEDLK